MWPRVTRYDYHKHGTNQDPSVFLNPMQIILFIIYYVIINLRE